MRAVALRLSLIMIFVIPWENAIDIAGVGTVSRAVGLVVALFWVATVIVTGKFRKPHPVHLVVYLFVLWSVASAFWSIDVDATVDRIQTYLQQLVMVFILWDLYTTKEALRAGLQAYILGAYVPIVSMFANYLTSSGDDPIRYTAAGFNDNDLGLILALGIPVAWYLVTKEAPSPGKSGGNGGMKRLLQLVNFAYILAAVLAIFLTTSRGSLVATIPAILFVFGSLTWLRLHLRVLLFMALLGLMFALQFFIPQYSFERLATTGTSIAEGDLSGRVDIWRQGLAAYSDHPLLGVGSGAFRTAVESGKVAHNVFISILVEVGPIGLVLFVTILAIVFHQAFQQSKWDAGLWLAVLLVWTLGATVHTWEQRKQTWLFISMVIVAAGLYSSRDESATQFTFQSKPQHITTRRTEDVYLELAEGIYE